jgi:hypothetical protein
MPYTNSMVMAYRKLFLLIIIFFYHFDRNAQSSTVIIDTTIEFVVIADSTGVLKKNKGIPCSS